MLNSFNYKGWRYSLCEKFSLPVYDKDVDAKAFVISKRGQVPDQVIEGERVMVPTFEIVSYPQVRFSQIKERRFNVIDRAQMRAKADIMSVEDEEIFRLVDEAATSGPNAVTVSTQGLTRAALTQAFKEIEKHDLVVTKIVMNAQAFADIRTWGRDEFDPVNFIG